MPNIKNAFYILLIFIIVMAFLYLVDHDFEFLHENLSGSSKDMHKIASLHYASLIILTFILSCIAWIQLDGINKTGKADFLLRIDEKLGDQNMIEARKIIHDIYSKSKDENPNFIEQQHWENIAK